MRKSKRLKMRLMAQLVRADRRWARKSDYGRGGLRLPLGGEVGTLHGFRFLSTELP